MNIGVPRYLVAGIAALFSGYHIVLGLFTIEVPKNPAAFLFAMTIYALATVMTLVPLGSSRMPVWMAVVCLTVAVVMIVTVAHQLDFQRQGGTGYATWYVGASGTLMAIVATRQRPVYAWAGISFLAVHSIIVAGPTALLDLGVTGGVAWVAVSQVMVTALAKASRDTHRLALAEREAADWQAAQEAHIHERQFRLRQTGVMALGILQRVQESDGDLSAFERLECLHLEAAIRDEIRGRRLLNDVVRNEVMRARRRGVTVTLLDEGGIDDLADADLERVHTVLADAIRGTRADKVIARTVPEGSDVAITVVGLRGADSEATALGQEPLEDDEVDLWLEVPRIR